MTPSDVKTVAENINDFIEVPDGLNRLRKAVLTLAVSGRIVPQDENEGTAEDLYIEMQVLRSEEEKRLAGLKRKIKDVAPVTKEEIPFEIPVNWKWVKLNQIGYTNIGLTYSPNDIANTGIPVLRSTNVQNGQIDLRELVRVNKEVKDSVLVKEGDLLICARNGSKSLVGKTAMIQNLNEQMAFGAFMAIYRSPYNPYIEIFLNSPVFRNLLEGVSTTTINQITQDNLKNTLIPLPPLLEQKRIVEKVKEVMMQLDFLESKKNDRDWAHSRLTRSAMQALGSADSKVAFEQLTELIKTSPDIKELENAILTLAVSGQLVVQDDREGSADDLYKKIQSEIKIKVKGKEQKLVTAVSVDEITFEIPQSWRWVRLIEIGKLDTGKTPRTGVTGNYDGDIPFIGPGDIQNGTINSYSKLVTVQGASESKYLYPGDVLMVCIGGTIGKTAYVNETYTFNQQINKITPFHTDGRYLSFVFKTEYFQKLVWGKASGGATPLVNLTRWSSCIVPLPPLAEQKRIVAKVEELLEMINSLRSIIDA